MLSKADLSASPADALAARIEVEGLGVPVVVSSAATGRGLPELAAAIGRGRTAEAELRFLESKEDPRARREDKERVKRLCKAQKRGYREG